MGMTRLIRVAFSVVLLFTLAGSQADAATITITASISDRGFDTAPPRDVYEGVYGNPSVILVDEDPIGAMFFHNERTAVEFPLGAIPAGSMISAVSLRLSNIFDSGSGGEIQVHGYVGDGAIQVADLMVSNLVGSFVLPVPDPANIVLSASWLQGLVDASDPFAGLMFKGTPSSTQIVFSFASAFSGVPVGLRPTLTIETQDAVIPEPGTLLLLGTGLVMAASRLRRKGRE